jgi:hypothetical protein
MKTGNVVQYILEYSRRADQIGSYSISVGEVYPVVLCGTVCYKDEPFAFVAVLMALDEEQIRIIRREIIDSI